MAIARIGSLTELDLSTNSGTQNINVPGTATLAVVGLSGYEGTVNYLSGGAPTLGGTAMTKVAADGDTAKSMAALWYLFSPTTGASVALAHDFAGTNVPAQGVVVVYGFYSGTDTGPVRASGGAQTDGGTPYTTASLTAASTDMIIAFGGSFSGGAVTWTWSAGATKVQDFDATTPFNAATGSWGEGSPSANTTVATVSTGGDGGVVAIVVKAGSGTSFVASPVTRRLQAVNTAASW